MGFGHGTRGYTRVTNNPSSSFSWNKSYGGGGGEIKGRGDTEEKNDLGESSLCSDARSSEKPRTNEGN